MTPLGLEGIVQYGIAALAMVGVFYYVVKPLIQQNSEAIKQNGDTLELLRKAVQEFCDRDRNAENAHQEVMSILRRLESDSDIVRRRNSEAS